MNVGGPLVGQWILSPQEPSDGKRKDEPACGPDEPPRIVAFWVIPSGGISWRRERVQGFASSGLDVSKLRVSLPIDQNRRFKSFCVV
jgi:hypothetical protein